MVLRGKALTTAPCLEILSMEEIQQLHEMIKATNKTSSLFSYAQTSLVIWPFDLSSVFESVTRLYQMISKIPLYITFYRS
jgi:hypothetical protein